MKVVTLRLSDDEYKKIAFSAGLEHRPISNFITTKTLKEIDESCYVDSIEMSQIRSDEKLLEKIKSGHNDAQKKRGGFVD